MSVGTCVAPDHVISLRSMSITSQVATAGVTETGEEHAGKRVLGVLREATTKNSSSFWPTSAKAPPVNHAVPGGQTSVYQC